MFDKQGEKMRKLYRVSQVSELLGVSQSTIWRWTNQGVFPEPKRFGHRVTAWDENQIKAFIQS